MAKKTTIGKLMDATFIEDRLIEPDKCFNATFIMDQRRNDKSYFKEYFDVLPQSFDNFPIFFTDEEMTWLEGSPVERYVKACINGAKTDYDMICKEVPEYSQFSLREFSETLMMTGSRTFWT